MEGHIMLYVETQFSIFLINKPGVLAQTLTALAKEKINIVAMTMMDSVEHGVLRLVTEKPDETRALFSKINATVDETKVICITLSNRAGALADVTSRLAEAHININYAYGTAGARGGKTTGILKVADTAKSVKILQRHFDNTKAKTTRKSKLRPSPGRRSR